MKSIKTWIAIIVLLSSIASNAQIKNAKTETVKIYGNCEMCETIIEKAGNRKKIAQVDWNKDSKMATIKYNAKKTNQDEILKLIALSGYDSDKFLAPNDVYAKLPDCCQYKRQAQAVASLEAPKVAEKENHSSHKHSEITQETPQFLAVFDTYFALKDALVKTDGNLASEKSKQLLAALKAVKMEKLAMEEHTVWMKVMKELLNDTQHIIENKEIKHQREHFITLSKNMYDLSKVTKQASPTYLQHCPMANNGKGADWLSKEYEVKNPYYGSMMLNCGKVVETIK